MQQRRTNGPAVRVIRELMGIRHGQLAKRVAINPGYLTKIETGNRQPSPEVTVRIANALGVSIEVISYPVTVLEYAA